MKKLIALLLSIILVLTFSGVSVIAATDDNQITVDEALPAEALTVELSSANTSAHKDVTLTLTLSSNPGFSVMILDLDHTSEEITLKSATSAVSGVTLEYSNYEGGSTLAFYHLGSNCTATGTLATLVFSIGSYSGNAEITLSAEEGNVCDTNATPVEPQFSNGIITVSCEHTYIFKDRVEPSCKAEGAINYVCTICGDLNVTPVDKAPHSYSSAKQILTKPTCDTAGVEAYVCEFCGDLKDETAVAPLGHKFIEGDPIVTKEATCTEAGSEYRHCYACNLNVATEIPVLGHDDGTWRTTTPGDCTTAGLVSRYCNRCDAVLESKAKEQGAHFMAWAVTIKPTCKEAGVEEYMCLICGGEKDGSRVVEKLDHIHGQEVITREPTCSVKGLAETYCELCDEVVASREIDTIAHTKNSLTVVEAPTSEAEGQGEYRCKICGETVESVTLPRVYGEFYAQTTKAAIGGNTSVKVFVKDNSGFSAGIVRIKYDETSLIYKGITAGDITDDITAGASKVGEITVLISLNDAEYTEDGLMFTINFTLTKDAENGNVELYYNPQTDFADRNGDRVFFNMKSAEIEIIHSIPGDVNGDLKVDTTDLAALKLYLVGLQDEVSPGANADGRGKIDTGDLATLKLMLAGIIK